MMLRRREGRGLMPRVGIFGLINLDNKFFRYVCLGDWVDE